MAGSCIVAIESRKHAARRPSPPLPRPASGSSSSKPSQSSDVRLTTSSARGSEHQIRDVVGQRATDQEFHREVINALGIEHS